MFRECDAAGMLMDGFSRPWFVASVSICPSMNWS